MIRATGRRRNEASPSGWRSSAGRRASRRSAAGSCRSCRSRGRRSGAASPSAPGDDDPVVDRPAVVARPLHGRPERARRSPAVERTSAPSPAPAIRLSPVARAASIRARWLIDLSPGRRSSPRSRAAGADLGDVGRRRASRATQCLRQPAAAADGRSAAIGSPCSAADVLVDRHERGHQVAELVEVELLLGVGQGLVRASGGPRP